MKKIHVSAINRKVRDDEKLFVEECDRKYNEKLVAIADSIEISDKAENAKLNTRRMGRMEREAAIERLTREMKEAAKLLDVAYQFCLNAEMDCVPSGAGYIYTASLDGAGMEAVAYAVAPEAEDLDVTLSSGSIQAFILDDELQYISFDCAGTIRVALVSAGVSIGARIDFSEEVPAAALPEAARKALTA